MTKKSEILLSEKFKDQLLSTKETGMGYHKVSVRLKNGRIIKDLLVLNCSVLKLDNTEKISIEDIMEIKVST